MENKREDEIRPFFEKNSTGRYIMWSSGHVVIVANGYVYEFSESAGGYNRTKVQDWNFHGRSYWIRRL